jgi:exonuclease-1
VCDAEQFVEHTDATRCLKFFLSMIKVLVTHGVSPIVVLDGRPLPSKLHEMRDRRDKRSANKLLARDAVHEGDTDKSTMHYKRAIAITPEIMRQVCSTLRENNIEFIVAPYEADAQLAFLSKQGLVDRVISEDSDCIPYGCKKIVSVYTYCHSC